MTVLLCIGALLGGWVIIGQTIDEWQKTPVSERRSFHTVEEVTDTARAYAGTQSGVSLEGYQVSTSFMSDGDGLTFLGRTSLSEEEQNAYQERLGISSAYYFVRFFKELTEEEYSVTVDAFRNTVSGYTHIIPEDTVVPDTSLASARTVAEAFLAKEGISPETYTALDASEVTLPGGKEYTFAFSRKGSELLSEYGEGYARIDLRVRGDVVVDYNHSIFVPENFFRETTQDSSMGSLFGLLSIFTIVAMTIASFVVMIRLFINKSARWKFPLAVTLVLLVLSVIDIWNTYPMALVWYTTDISLTVYGISLGVGTIMVSLLILAGFFIPAVAGISYAYETDTARFAPLTALPRRGVNLASYVYALARGYLIGIMGLGLTLALFWIGEEYLGVWYLDFAGAEEFDSLVSYVPAFTYALSFGLMAAITEEFLFRMFGILVFRRIFKSTVIAVIFATLVWAFAHSDGTVFPVWFRGLEVFLGGLLWAYFFIRYNVLTTVVAHYVHNTIIAAGMLVIGLGYGQIIPSILMLGLPWIILGVAYLWGRRKKYPELSEVSPEVM